MKKLNKLGITPEKILKNEELINLQGGYGGGSGLYCRCEGYDGGSSFDLGSGYCGPSDITSCAECGSWMQAYYGFPVYCY
jgi:hypothetical protein